MSHSCGCYESDSKVLAGLCSLANLQGGILPGLFQLLMLAGFGPSKGSEGESVLCLSPRFCDNWKSLLFLGLQSIAQSLPASHGITFPLCLYIVFPLCTSASEFPSSYEDTSCIVLGVHLTPAWLYLN